MYGVVLHLDSDTEQKIVKLWKELDGLEISHYAEEIPDRRPHITLADYSELDEKTFTEMFRAFYSSKTKFTLTLGVLGTFLQSGTLFLAPTPTLKLIELHADHHDHFKEYAGFSNPLYAPGMWIPHSTIANRLNGQKLAEALRYCTGKSQVLTAEVVEISIIKLLYKDNQCVSAPAIFSQKLL
ncbi:2'-5' RNA ligase family protein [Paenibacillus donghaensis]|uniref:2'-5' RNA ligase family protein n=1 Tax=Paenibacillus donghaensis TaxID=414771 RepID=UPI00188328BF|nr:2'-5' RNA ligase family protein [Paenibacillus donghaensis]MBE9917777.1 2'-5' RNA ligase family protein [Paenibacillus donghaensis]